MKKILFGVFAGLISVSAFAACGPHQDCPNENDRLVVDGVGCYTCHTAGNGGCGDGYMLAVLGGARVKGSGGNTNGQIISDALWSCKAGGAMYDDHWTYRSAIPVCKNGGLLRKDPNAHKVLYEGSYGDSRVTTGGGVYVGGAAANTACIKYECGNGFRPSSDGKKCVKGSGGGNGNGGGGNPGGGNPGGGSSNVSGPCGNEIRTTNTAGRGAYIVHWYRVKGWGGTYPGNGINDFNCTMAGKHLDIYEEDGTWYARGPNKCVPESKRPGCTQAYPEGQAPGVKPGDDSKKKCEDSFGTWTNGACVCDANKNLIKDATGFCACKGADYVRVPASKSCEMTDTAKLKTLCEAAATSGAVWNGTECTCPEENKDWNGASCVVSVAYEQCKSISDATWNAVTKKCVCNDETKAVNEAGTKCEEKAEYKQKRELGAATKSINAAVDSLKSFAGGLDVSKWKDEEGKFNTARLASDVTAGVVLGTAGALITSSVVKKHQVEDGFEDISCTIGGQTVAGWGDEFTVGVH